MYVEWGEADYCVEPMHVVVAFGCFHSVRAAPKAMCPQHGTHNVSYQNVSQFFYVAFFPYLFWSYFFFSFRSPVWSASRVLRLCTSCVCVGSVWCAPAPHCAPIRPIECVPLFHGNSCEIVPPMLATHTRASVPLELLLATPSTIRIHTVFFCFVFFISISFLSIALHIIISGLPVWVVVCKIEFWEKSNNLWGDRRFWHSNRFIRL